MRKLLDHTQVLCLSPHPDDVELAMSGTIAKCCRTCFHILTCSCGSKGDSTSQESRFTEVSKFWTELKTPNTYYTNLNLDLPSLTEDQLITLFSEYVAQCTAIVIPPKLDSHFEHRIINSLGIALARNKPISLVEYKTFSTLHEWIPNFFVDIEKQYAQKIWSLKVAFTSQNHRSYFSPEALMVYNSDFACIKKGLKTVEQFRILNHYV